MRLGAVGSSSMGAERREALSPNEQSTPFAFNQSSPSSVVECQACEPKGRWFDSQSGHKPGLWARSPFGDMQEATNGCISRTLMFLSLSLPSPLSRHKSIKS